MKPSFQRILLKMSGEILKGAETSGLAYPVVYSIASDIAAVHALGVEIGIVIGGGNFIRGGKAGGVTDRVSADHMGMLATVINGLALQDAMEKTGVPTRLMSAIQMNEICEPFIRRRAVRHLEKGRVVILSAGTGNPYFTTDTAAVLRALELRAEVLLKATKVDGVYAADPETVPDAVRYDVLGYRDVLAKELRVMDGAAVVLCMEYKLPIIVFNLQERGNVVKVVCGEKLGTLIKETP